MGCWLEEEEGDSIELPIFDLLFMKYYIFKNLIIFLCCQFEILKDLRVEFCGSLLVDKANQLHNEIINKAKDWVKTETIKFVGEH